ncbi:GAF domain-containing protein [Leptospira sp. 2 VSF19]|uniref:GAF domain-containing protein n=1 Tax=Leptospira soteropolitanensis TaxID=2950025 RepID=A0AAW5VHX5_9LEPT|nr:HD family phosphohydrolase [Leptospira soteropolitanensis]MCW7494521.1 GAF domain-containing protein [Leptospira soteropolitanensis]MCW7502115.1 GAF domain-containing protein [Leptospira soteropolitanensis]MCW7524367.1 GAF domain-containing protein [Leptospira soteropolitanensis]MCW7528233.1 GAF domain-containing protein [Leptospira soteropolitanensis]MCW7532085.1 GAF domain-containing protein [Leptospira soteropolitanensis]
MPVTKSSDSQFIITDDPFFEGKIADYSKKIKAKVLTLAKLDQIESDSHGRIAKVLFYISRYELESKHKEIHQFLKDHPTIMSNFIVRAPIDYTGYIALDIEEDLFFTNVPDEAPLVFLVKALANAFTSLQMIVDKFELQKRINVSTNEISKLTKIGISLANEKDFTKLLRDILNSAREISNSDSGSLYLVEKDERGNPRNLRFKISALDLNSDEFILPINKKSIAGYVAFTGKQLNIPNVYELSGKEEYKFNSDFDKMSNYYSKSMLVVPMKDHHDEVVGVIQLINRKKNFQTKLTLEEMKSNSILEYDKYSEELVMAVAGQAAVAIQNNNLVHDIETLFEGFVTASVSAIESRDPTTSGHSFRVAQYTVGLAESVNAIQTGRFKDIHFNESQVKEIRYASLLHDFGKVGVREKVLVKAKKLEDYELDLIRWRFQFILKDVEAKLSQKKIEYLKKHGNSGYAEFEKSIQLEYTLEKEKLEEMVRVISESNEPSILEEGNSNFLEEISKMSYHTTDGNQLNLLMPKEFGFLSIRRGSLDFEERREIESHVEHTFQFLSKIPWTRELKMVPAIAHGHHEKLNGSGYPRGLSAVEIPVQAKMMAIADIFDALTDQDRPYKKAVPLERAFDILKMEVRDQHIDGDLLDIFIGSKAYEKISHKR